MTSIIDRSTALVLEGIAVRSRLLSLVLVGIISLGIGGAAKAEPELDCPNSALPSEGSSTSEEQLGMLAKQATICVKQGKPRQAVALLTEVIRRAPTRLAWLFGTGLESRHEPFTTLSAA